MTTVTDLTRERDVLTEALDKARRQKKGTKTIREQLAEVERQLDEITAVETEAVEASVEVDKVVETPKRRGRPRKYDDLYYVVRDAFKRTGRGRPNRDTVVTDLVRLGVPVDPTLAEQVEFPALERARSTRYDEVVEAAKVGKRLDGIAV